jgi:transcription initiation factor TFIIB
LSGDRRPGRSEARIALGELEEFSERLSVPPEVKCEAVRICQKGLERSRLRRRSPALISASSLYAACRAREVSATLDDVASASGVSRIDLARCYRLLVTELDLRIPVADPAECLARVASRAKVSSRVEADALEILSEAGKAGVTAGLYPTGLAASALYVASILDGERISQSRAAEAAGVRDATVRKQYKRIRSVLGLSASGNDPDRQLSTE